MTTILIESRILSVRGLKVLLDSDLADLYGVTTSALNQAVKRNSGRFPDDFVFQLNPEEAERLKSQIVISNVLTVTNSIESSRGGRRRSHPHAFTEHGVAMLSSVLSSERAIQVNISIIRAFAELRRSLTSNQELALKVSAIEERYDRQFETVFEALDFLMMPEEEKPKRKMGFTRED